MKRGRGRRIAGIVLGAVCLLVVLLVIIGEAVLQGEESEQLARRTESVRKEVRALAAIAAKGDELAAKLTEMRSKIATLQKILPESLAFAEFKTAYEAECAPRGITVAGWKTREDRSQELQRGVITAELVGDLTRVPDLEARMRWRSRLAEWRQVKREGDVETVELTVYALPMKAPEKPRASCTGRASSVWLWPFTSRLRPRQQELEDACRELSALSAAQAQADEYQRLRTHLLAAVSEIEKLRPESRGP